MEKIQIGLIGAGYWGSILKKYIEENRAFNLRCVCNSKSDLNEVWEDESITAVVIAVPNKVRYLIIRDALLSNKNVLSEKPLALKTSECKNLKEIALDRNLLLMVDYTWTFSKGLLKAQHLVNEGKIGDLLGLEMSVKHLGRFGGGSVYWLLGSHMLSVLDMFIPISETVFLRKDIVVNKEIVETGVISFRRKDVSGQITLSLNYPGKETKVIVYGENGSIIFDGVSEPSLQMETYERVQWVVPTKLPHEHFEYQIDETNNLCYAVEYFAHALQGTAEGNLDRAVMITKILEKLERDEDEIWISASI